MFTIALLASPWLLCLGASNSALKPYNNAGLRNRSNLKSVLIWNFAPQQKLELKLSAHCTQKFVNKIITLSVTIVGILHLPYVVKHSIM